MSAEVQHAEHDEGDTTVNIEIKKDSTEKVVDTPVNIESISVEKPIGFSVHKDTNTITDKEITDKIERVLSPTQIKQPKKRLEDLMKDDTPILINGIVREEENVVIEDIDEIIPEPIRDEDILRVNSPQYKEPTKKIVEKDVTESSESKVKETPKKVHKERVLSPMFRDKHYVIQPSSSPVSVNRVPAVSSFKPSPVVSRKPGRPFQSIVNTVNKFDLPPPPEEVSTPKQVKIVKEMPEYDSMSPKERAAHRSDFMTKIGTIRRAHEDLKIPQVDPNISLDELHILYHGYLHDVFIRKEADKYKLYLSVFWLFIEIGCKKYGIDIPGFTKAQMAASHKYEMLLMELGEEKYSATNASGSANKWPVEIRLVFMTIINAVAFGVMSHLCKWFSKDDAHSIMEEFTNMLSGNTKTPEEIALGKDTQRSGIGMSDIIGMATNIFAGNPGSKTVKDSDPDAFEPIYEE